MRRTLITLALAVAVVAQPPVATPVRAASEYFLPAPAGTTLLVFQGNNSAFDHVAANGSQYAWDFTEGTTEFPVVASRGGTVIGFRSDSTNTQCRDISCWKDANYVLVDHGDGTSALYLHLATGSVKVTKNQKVGHGAPLGLADSTGFSYGTHLHFMVEKTPTARTAAGWWWTQSEPITFVDAGSAIEGMSYVSANQPAGTPIATPTAISTPKPTATPLTVPQTPADASGTADGTYYKADSLTPFACINAADAARGACLTVVLHWRASAGATAYRIYVAECPTVLEGARTCGPIRLAGVVSRTSFEARVVTSGERWYVAAFNQAGSSARVLAFDLTIVG
jgi:hypothetical protein